MNSDNASASYGSILRLSNALSLRRKCLGYRGCYTEIQIPRRTTADIYGSLIHRKDRRHWTVENQIYI
jgi:hypothetical protein